LLYRTKIKIQYLSIQIINSKYKIIYILLIYIITVLLFNTNTTTFCMVTDEDNAEILRASEESLFFPNNITNTMEVLLLENQLDVAQGANETLRLQNDRLQTEVEHLRSLVNIQQQEIQNLTNLYNNISTNYRELHAASRELQQENQNLNTQVIQLTQRILNSSQR
jgi:hypothetical protein